jgi:hypothetical protein
LGPTDPFKNSNVNGIIEYICGEYTPAQGANLVILITPGYWHPHGCTNGILNSKMIYHHTAPLLHCSFVLQVHCGKGVKDIVYLYAVKVRAF